MAEINLVVEANERGPWTVLALEGEIDLYTAPKLKEQISELVATDRAQLVVDLSRVEFLDSTGLGVLIGGLKRAREKGGELALAGATEPVRKVLSITGLDKVFPLHDDVDVATGA
ncbi:MAG TPA: STAS domain-containing protein [Actinomycetota bacterium]|nr:STAS domain-containing protein [Actinomycetota bacterium]